MIDILCSKLPATFCEIDQLAAILLRFCRDHAGHLRLAYDYDEICELLYDEADSAQIWFETELDEDFLDDEELGVIGDTLRRIAAQAEDLTASLIGPEKAKAVAAVVAARAMAEAIDRSHGPRFAGVFRGRGVTMVSAGDPIPITQPPLKKLFAGDLGTNPLRLGPQLDDLVWLRLMPDVARGHQVRLDFRHEHALADLEPDSKVAVLIPSGVQDDLEFSRTDEPAPRFFGVRPKNAAQQRDTILKLLDDAIARGARIALLPELSIDADTLEAIKVWHAERRHELALLVCGSIHTEYEGQRRNLSVTLLADGETTEHCKFNPFYLPMPSLSGGGERNYREDIVTVPSVITITNCGDWSYSTLICKDFLEPGVAQILEETRVRLVLVPACSPKTAIFEQIAGILAARAQAVVVVGNLADPSDINPASVIVARPVQLGTVEAIRRTETTVPGLYVFDFAKRRAHSS